MAGRQFWRLGGLYVGDIFTLLLPGIDLNDPGKTGLSCMAISNMVDFIRLGDISEVDGSSATAGSRSLRKATRALAADDPNDPTQHELEDLSPEELDERLRFSTSIFRDWVPEFLGRVLLLFSNLPEEGGKSGRAGGKTEQLTLTSVLVSIPSVSAVHA
jgi:proteasome activator subunit 4